MCLPPATRTGGEIRKRPAKAESWSGQQVGVGAECERLFALRDETPGMQEGWQTAPLQGGALVSLDQALYNKTVLVRAVEGGEVLGLGGKAKRARMPGTPPECAQPGGRCVFCAPAFQRKRTAERERRFPSGLLRKQPLGDMVNRHCSPAGHSSAQESVMDFLFFFVGIIAVICALTYIKKTSPNRHH